MTPTILVVEGEPAIQELVAINLKHAGFLVVRAGSAEEGESAIRAALPDLVILDWMLPGQSGVALAKKLRADERTRELPIIMLTARVHEEDKVQGLEAGADDYITKPFEPAEVVARIRARLRKPAQGATTRAQTLRFAGWTADFDRYLLTSPNGTETPLSHAEAEVLRLFTDNPRRLITRAQMLETLGGTAGDSFDRAMDVRISRLRTKLGEDPKNPRLIKTIYGAGYIFLAEIG